MFHPWCTDLGVENYVGMNENGGGIPQKWINTAVFNKEHDDNLLDLGFETKPIALSRQAQHAAVYICPGQNLQV